MAASAWTRATSGSSRMHASSATWACANPRAWALPRRSPSSSVRRARSSASSSRPRNHSEWRAQTWQATPGLSPNDAIMALS